MTNILVTGSNGQLGIELGVLARNYPELTFTLTDLPELDITNQHLLEEFISSGNFDFIINCAAYTAVDKAEEEPEKAYLINETGVRNLARGAKNCGSKFIHISTDYVFDGLANVPYKENDATNPQSAYGNSKLAGEKAIMEIGGSAVIVRTSWLYSPFGNNFMKTILRLARERNELNIVFDQTGTPTYSEHLAHGILQIIETSVRQPNSFHEGIYHFANEGVCSWYDFALEIIEQANINCKINPIETGDYPTLAKRPQYSVMSKAKFRSVFCFDIPHWKSGVKNCINRLELY